MKKIIGLIMLGFVICGTMNLYAEDMAPVAHGYIWNHDSEVTAFAFETMTVTNSTAGLTATAYDSAGVTREADRAVITVETDSIRYRTDGSTSNTGLPTTAIGHLAYSGTVIILEGPTNIENFKAIRVTTDAKIAITYERYTKSW